MPQLSNRKQVFPALPTKGTAPDGQLAARAATLSRLRIVPVNAIEDNVLAGLGPCLEERFLYSSTLERSLCVPRAAVNSARGQMFSSALSLRIANAYSGEGDLFLGITEFDLYKTSRRFVFGDADERRGVALVSLHRFAGEFYGEPADANLLLQRTVKESVHQLGHLLRLAHCLHARCAMYPSNSVFETDNKWSYFCDSCDRRCRARN
jgi:predicted Zn-dependent protease